MYWIYQSDVICRGIEQFSGELGISFPKRKKIEYPVLYYKAY